MGRAARTLYQPRPIPATGVIEPPASWDVIDVGWDYWQEAFEVRLFDATDPMLEAARVEAANLDTMNKGRVLIRVGVEEFQVHPRGMKGVRSVLENADMIVMVRAPSSEWPISIRCRASALWQHGLPAMRDRMETVALALGDPSSDDWRRVSRCDLAFDTWAPEFGEHMSPALFDCAVQPGRAKESAWGRRGKLETFTMGSPANLQVQIYDKGNDLAEHVEKQWMTVAWSRAGREVDPDAIPKRTIWRVEARFGKEYLDARGLKRPNDAIAHRVAMATEAIWARRITVPSSDSNRHRWKLHPLFALCWRGTGEMDEMPPLGKIYDTATKTAKQRQLRTQMAGLGRNLTVLSGDGQYTDAGLLAEWGQVADVLADDARHKDKVAIAAERYRYIYEGG